MIEDVSLSFNRTHQSLEAATAETVGTRLTRRQLLSGMPVAATLSGSWAEATATPAPSDVSVDLILAYLYNLGRFAQWPTSDVVANTFTICLVGNHPFGKRYEPLMSRKLHGLPVGILELRREPSAADGCRIAYVADVTPLDIRELLLRMRSMSILTVSAAPRFLAVGGMVQFFSEGDALRFSIDKDALMPSGIRLASQLMQLSRPLPAP